MDDVEEVLDDNIEDGLNDDFGRGPKEDSDISFGYALASLIAIKVQFANF